MNRSLYFIFQAMLALISPIVSFTMSLRTYKSAVSQFFFIVFAFYFGCHCRFFYDISFHYYEFLTYYVGHSFIEIINNPLTFIHGHDLFHVLVKYGISLFTSSQAVFGGVFCAIHFGMFLFFFRQLKDSYLKHISYASGLMLLTVCLVFQFWWYSNFRYCCAVFYFGGFYLKYVNSNKPIYLLLAALCPFFHYTASIFTGVIIIELLYKYVFKAKFFRYAALALSLFVRTLNYDFVPFLVQHIPWLNENMSYAVVNTESRKKVVAAQQAYRDEGNIVYNIRSYVLLLVGLFVLYLFKTCKVPSANKYKPIFYMFLTIFTLANFGYGDLHVHNRLLQTSMLFLWSYIFIISVEYGHLMMHRNMLLCVILILPVVYFFITPIFQFRAAILQPELFFGNFFMDWSGNDLDVEYATYKRVR